MYTLKIIYDTGDSFHHETGLENNIEMKWKNVNKAKRALKDIEAHYYYYMMMNKEWGVDKKDKDKAQKDAEKQPWYDKEYPEFHLSLENDDGNRVGEHVFWAGYFETLVGVDVVSISEDDGMSVRFGRYK